MLSQKAQSSDTVHINGKHDETATNIIGSVSQQQGQYKEFLNIDLDQSVIKNLEVIEPHNSLSTHIEPWPKGQLAQPIRGGKL